MRWAIVLLPAFLLGCTTGQDIYDGMTQFRGQPIDNVVAVLGTPNDERMIAGRRYVIWSTDRNVSYTMPVTNYTSGSITASGGGFATYGGTTTTQVPMISNYVCTLTVEVNNQYIVRDFSFDGNTGGCEVYASRLRSFLRNLPPA